MKFGIMFANVGPLARPELLAHLAQQSERSGLESLWTVEHVVVPVGYESAYPYSKNGRMPVGEDADITDPLVTLGFLAALTKTLRLATGILILPQRHPFYVAKELATLDQLSGGRAILGIGIGWLKEEFDALGIRFEDRAARTREEVAALRSLWKAEPEAFDGKYFAWPAVHSRPLPCQPGGIPIVVGGHTPTAAKRAARYGDGFFPGVFDPGQLSALRRVLEEECKVVGRAVEDIEITAIAPGRDLDAIKRLRDAGASRLVMPPPGRDAATLTSGLEAFQEQVSSKL